MSERHAAKWISLAAGVGLLLARSLTCHAQLPSAQGLVNQALAIKSEGAYFWPLPVIAEAQARLGDVRRALMIALSDDWLEGRLALAMIVQVQVERGDLQGAMETIALAARDDRAMLYTTAAEQQAMQGDLDGALSTLQLLKERVPEKSTIATSFREGLLSKVARKQDLPLAMRRAAVDALMVIARAHTDDFALFPNGVFPGLVDPNTKLDGTDAIDPQRWTRIAAICVALGDTEKAESAIAAAKELLAKERPDLLLLEDAVSLATTQQRLGLPQEAAQTFQQALDMYPLLDDYPSVRAPAMTAIGKGHLQCGRPAEANAAFEHALQLEAQSDNNNGSNASSIVRILAAAEDWKGAKQVCQQVSKPVYRYYSFAEIAQAQAADDDNQGAAATIREGFQLADGLTKLEERIDFLCLLVPIASEIGDTALVDDLLTRASQTADEAGGDETWELLSPLQRIARAQIQVGRLSAAWDTIGRIHEPHLRCFPLAELALAAAKAETKLKQ